MDKNNDMQVYKISKWDAAPKNMGTLFTYIELVVGMACSLPSEIRDNLYDLMDKTLDEYNELEAKYQKDTGMISEYEEENRSLKSELNIKTDECDALISRVFKQDEEYTELKKENKELRETRELLNEVNSKQCAEVDNLEADIRDLEVQVRVNKGIASLYESEIKQVIELAKSYGLIIHDDRKDAKPDDAINISMCGHYYVLGKDPKKENDRLRNRCNELAYRACKYSWAIKTVLKKASFSPGHIAEELRFMARESTTPKDVAERWEGYANELLGGRAKEEKEYIQKLEKKIETLEKESKELKDTLNEDREFGKYVGKCVADSIQEGWKYGAYELHPCTRIDIRVEETKNTSISSNRYSIPNVVVLFNNIQTEMERDTAEHECEELDRKFKELVEENEDLRTTIKMCELDANAARNLCDNIAFNAERAKNKTPWFNE